MVDDSIVRGTTSKKIVQMLRRVGAIGAYGGSFTSYKIPCYYGIDTSRREELIANNMETDEIREFIGADSLIYISREGMRDALQKNPPCFCDACFSGIYPLPVESIEE